MKRIVTKIDSHRNGVSGMPFYLGMILDDDGTKKLFITFPDYGEEGSKEEERVVSGSCRTAILDLDLLKDDVIEFGQNSWRGDIYHDLIVDTINVKNKVELLELQSI
jgi:hypothetical protein|tara:strand:+ start:333 stop:653 length:321 start_codon:yes stop_codon:yes gene_type:complete